MYSVSKCTAHVYVCLWVLIVNAANRIYPVFQNRVFKSPAVCGHPSGIAPTRLIGWSLSLEAVVKPGTLKP